MHRVGSVTFGVGSVTVVLVVSFSCYACDSGRTLAILVIHEDSSQQRITGKRGALYLDVPWIYKEDFCA